MALFETLLCILQIFMLTVMSMWTVSKAKPQLNRDPGWLGQDSLLKSGIPVILFMINCTGFLFTHRTSTSSHLVGKKKSDFSPSVNIDPCFNSISYVERDLLLYNKKSFIWCQNANKQKKPLKKKNNNCGINYWAGFASFLPNAEMKLPLKGLGGEEAITAWISI